MGDFSRLRGNFTTSRRFQPGERPGREEPDKLKELQAKFLEEAKKYDVFPLDPRFSERMDPKLRVAGQPPTSWTYFGNDVWLPSRSARNFSHGRTRSPLKSTYPRAVRKESLVPVRSQPAGRSMSKMANQIFATRFSTLPM